MIFDSNPKDISVTQGVKPPEAMAPNVAPIGPEQLQKFMQILQKYKAGKAMTEQRIVALRIGGS